MSGIFVQRFCRPQWNRSCSNFYAAAELSREVEIMDHSLLEAIGHNLTAPMPLFFVLGILATLIRSDLKVPEALYIGLTLYLLAAIGLHGGAEIREVGLTAIWMPLVGTLFLGIMIPIIGYLILRKVGKF